MRVREILASMVLAVAATTSFALPVREIPVGWMGDITTDGQDIYMSTMAGSRPIVRIDPRTGNILDVFEQSPFTVSGPRGIAFDGIDRLFMTDMNRSVCELTTRGDRIDCFKIPFGIPNVPETFRTGAIAFDGTNLYVGDVDTGTVLVTDRSGYVIRSFDSGMRPDGMVFDESAGHLWAVDIFTTNRLSEFTTDGMLVRRCSFNYEPGDFGLSGITLIRGKFYIAEPSNPFEPAAGTRLRSVQRNSLRCDPPIHGPGSRITPQR